MNTIRLLRTLYHETFTAGHIALPNYETCFATLEDPWKDNKVGVSCIPEGDYICKRDYTGKHRYYKILDVPGRSAIEIHGGRTHLHTRGCVLLGLYLINHHLHQSGKALDLFVDEMGEDDFKLEIRSL